MTPSKLYQGHSSIASDLISAGFSCSNLKKLLDLNLTNQMVEAMSSEEISTLFFLSINKLKDHLRFLKDLVRKAGISVALLGDCFYGLSIDKVENTIYILKNKILPYYYEHLLKMKSVVVDFFDRIYSCLNNIQLLYLCRKKIE